MPEAVPALDERARGAASPSGYRPTLRLRLLAVGSVLFALTNALWSAWGQGWTYDEPFHMLWSERFLASRVVERASQERLNSKTPIVLPNVVARQAAAARGAPEPRGTRFAARLPSALWLLALLGTVFVFTRTAFGLRAALIATFLTGLDPNLAAHASLATVDVAYACAHLLCLAAALAFASGPGVARGAALGAAVGLAFAAKFSAVLLLPCLAVLPFLVRVPWRRAVLPLAAAAAAAWVVLCGFYLFDRIGLPLATQEWRSGPFQALTRAAPGLRVPLPGGFLSGVDATLATERGDWNSVILGRRFPHGAWYYFAVLWLLKTPLLLLVAQAVGFWRAWRDPSVAGNPAARLLAWSLVVLLAYFSLVFRAHIGYRFVLMCIPLACILAAAGIASLPLKPGVHWAARAFMALAVLENAMYFGNPLSFSNAAVQPKRSAYRLMADSNLNWGQNRERLEGLLKAARMETTQLDPVHLQPGHNTLDVNALAGVWDFEQHRWVRENLTPGGHVGHTHVWFEADNDTFDRYLHEARRLVPGQVPPGLCPADLTWQDHTIGSRIPWSVTRSPRAGEGWAVCLEARKGGDFGLKVTGGYAWLGAFRADGTCVPRLMTSGQVAWYRLEPGAHALCVEEVPNRRAWIPYGLEGTWLVRGRGMRMGLRPLFLTVSTPPLPGGSIPRSWSPPPPPGG
jgi:hypothetical protein